MWYDFRRMSKAPFVLLVNPWICDFAAHDLWAKPLGLLHLGALLREGGCRVAFVDCMDRRDPATQQSKHLLQGDNQKFGCGKYPKIPVPTPEALKDIPRRYYRYGIHPDSFRNKLREIEKPDWIFVTSVMTYWYPGVSATIEVLKECFPEVPVWLGGIYARLCPGHARRSSGADFVADLPIAQIRGRIESEAHFSLSNPASWESFERSPRPAMDLVKDPTYIPLLTGVGCSHRCPYCASHQLQPKRERRSADALYDEISAWRDRGICDFAFYDDALLLDADAYLEPVLLRLDDEKPKVRFHTPNGLHVNALTSKWCEFLYHSGFETIRLGLETIWPERQHLLGGKVEMRAFFEAVENLFTAGFRGDQIGVYLLCGLPGQTVDEVSESIRRVAETGVQPRICEYSPIPGTAMWNEAVSVSSFDLENEPLYHNNSFFACRRRDFGYGDMVMLRNLARSFRLRDLQ
jgi:hypothetical protein